MDVPDVIEGELALMAGAAGSEIVVSWRRPDRDMRLSAILDYVADKHGAAGVFALLVTVVGTSFVRSSVKVQVVDGSGSNIAQGVVAFIDAVRGFEFPLAWDIFQLWVPLHEEQAPESAAAWVTAIIHLAMMNHFGFEL